MRGCGVKNSLTSVYVQAHFVSLMASRGLLARFWCIHDILLVPLFPLHVGHFWFGVTVRCHEQNLHHKIQDGGR